MKVSNVASVRKIVAAVVVGGLVFIGFDAVIRGAKHNYDASSSKTGKCAGLPIIDGPEIERIQRIFRMMGWGSTEST